MLSQYHLSMPGAVYSGEGALDRIEGILSGQAARVAVFTDKGIVGAGLLERPLSVIRKAVGEIVVLDDLPAEPTCDQAQQVVEQFKKTEADFIIAVGGGSVMDTAKLASVLATDRYGVRDLLDTPGLASKCVRTLMVPTTAGTGSEATPNSIVAVPEKELKVGIVNEAMIADFVILDADMVKDLPRSIAAATGVDALAHAIECFTSKKANPFSDLFALHALDLILNNIEEACDNPGAMDAKRNMLMGSFLAGVAITASGTTAVHALSYPLGGKYHIPHGVSNAIMLAPVMRFNEPVCRERFAQAYDRVTAHGFEQAGNGEPSGGGVTIGRASSSGDGVPMGRASLAAETTVEGKSRWLLERMSEIVAHLDIPTSLQQFGVPKEDLDILVASGMDVQRLLSNNMRPVTPEDARALYQEIL